MSHILLICAICIVINVVKYGDGYSGDGETVLPEEDGDERDGDDEQVEQVESGPAEGAGVQDEAVGDHLEEHLDGEDRREEVVEVVQDLIRFKSAFNVNCPQYLHLI